MAKRRDVNVCATCEHFYTAHGPRGCRAPGCSCTLVTKNREPISEEKTMWKKKR